MTALHIHPVRGLPEFQPGDDLAGAIAEALVQQGLAVRADDVLIVTQKVVSKVEGARIELATVQPSDLAERWARAWGKDPRAVEVVLREARRIVRMERGVLITETRHGLVCANSGVDASNVEPGWLTLLPEDPDASARRLRQGLAARCGVAPGVVISDTFGRPWRDGLVNVAIGMAGIAPLRDYKGQRDRYGHELQVSALAIGDELASAAELVMGKLDGVPVALVRGLVFEVDTERGAAAYVRPPELDLFR